MQPSELPAVTPRFVQCRQDRLVGVARRFTFENRALIPQFWQEAIAEIGSAMFGTQTFGASYDFGEADFTYMVGLRDDGRLDSEHFDHLILPGGDYAVFEHEGYISTISSTWTAIFDTWMPNANVASTGGPEFERYASDFDPSKPGGVSIWIPVIRDQTT